MVNHPNRNNLSTTTLTNPSPVDWQKHDHDRDYNDLIGAVHRGFNQHADMAGPIFQTDATTCGLYDLYLDCLPSERQVHTCNCCKRFIETYGGLARVNPNTGKLQSVMWGSHDVPLFYGDAFNELEKAVERSTIVSVFHSSETMWGTPKTGPWTHLHVKPHVIYPKRSVLTADQAMAKSIQDFETVRRAVGEYKMHMLEEAKRILLADVLSRSDKFIGPIDFLIDVRRLLDMRKTLSLNAYHLIWQKVATAPDGYLHPKASAIGSLLDDLEAGLPIKDVTAKFNAKLHPLKYQRPQAAPSAGNIKAAEEIVAKLGIAESLVRRFARFDEIETFWKPQKENLSTKTGGSVFSHLKAKGSQENEKEVIKHDRSMTWSKFKRTVLVNATKLEFYVPYDGQFTGILTAMYPDSPPILKWDDEHARNPFSTYIYHGGSQARRWNLAQYRWVAVNGITMSPDNWYTGINSNAEILVLEGAKDIGKNQGNCLFPEILKSELHSIRSTIESYSKAATIEGFDEASACGYTLSTSNAHASIRAFVNGGWSQYQIDRFD